MLPNDRKNYKDNVVQVKPVKKILPYSVTDISNIGEWRAEQKIKELEFKARQAASARIRREQAIAVLQGGIRSKEALQNDLMAEKASKAFRAPRKVIVAEALAIIANQSPPKIPLYVRLWQKCLDIFLSLRFD